MDEITKKRNKNIIENHLREVDVILSDLMDEIEFSSIDIISPQMINDMYKLAFKKWEFLYNYELIKKYFL